MTAAKSQRRRRARLIAAATGALGLAAILVAALITLGGSNNGSNATNRQPTPPPGVSAAIGDLRITNATARESLNSVAAVYFTVSNEGATDDAVTGAAVGQDLAQFADLHTTVSNGASAQMQTVQSIPVPAHGAVQFKTGGNHVMINGLKQDLKAGETLTLTLTFERAGQVTLKLPVLSYAEAP